MHSRLVSPPRGKGGHRWFAAGVGLALLVQLSSVAHADQPSPAPPPTRPTSPSSPALDFSFFGEQGSGTSSQEQVGLQRRSDRRRWMLRTHQLLGISTWVLMVATVTVGQLNNNQLWGGGGSAKYQAWHRDLVIATSSAFVGAGTFALLAPTPYPKPLRLDSGLVHRIAVTAATAGMVTQVILGIWTNRQANTGNPHFLREMERTHQIVGYTTLSCLTVAGAVWVF